MEKLESELNISKNANSLLVQEIDNLHKYQYQAYQVIDDGPNHAMKKPRTILERRQQMS